MRITQFGTLTFVEGEGPKIEGWQVERDADDPADATNEQLFLGLVVTWAKQKFDDAIRAAETKGALDAFFRKQIEHARDAREYGDE